MRRFFCNLNSLNLNSLNTDAENTLQCNPMLKLTELSIGHNLTLPNDVFHHWCRVLRAKIGDKGILFDGLGGSCGVQLETIDKKSATAKIISIHQNDYTPSYRTTIAIVMSRGDKMDYVIQKSTELGATVIQLLTSHHGEVRLKANQVEKKLNHWQQVSISACEQCGLNRPTIILSPISIQDYLLGEAGTCHESISYLLNDDYYKSFLTQQALPLVLAVPNNDEDRVEVLESIQNQLSLQSKNNFTRFDILIGPEGGLSDKEYQMSREKNFLPWQLGNRVLRTETAPVVALSNLMAIDSLR